MVVVVTGVSRGIGQAIVETLLARNQIVVGMSRSEPKLKHENFHFVAGDVTSKQDSQKVLDAAAKLGSIDALVLNAGVLDPVSKVADASVDGWKKLFDINFFSVVEMVILALPALRKNHGKIIMTSSGAATSHYLGWGAYGASKAAMNHLAATLGAEEPDVITVSVRPGVVDTNMQDDIRAQYGDAMGDSHKKFLELKATGKLLSADQPGTVLANLAIDADKSLSGGFYSWDSPELSKYGK